jgi:hypothetical protein
MSADLCNDQSALQQQLHAEEAVAAVTSLPQPLLQPNNTTQEEASGAHKLDILRQQIHDQEELVGAMLAARQQRSDLMTSLKTLKELARLDGMDTATVSSSQSNEKGGGEAEALQSDVQELLAAVEASMKAQESALRGMRQARVNSLNTDQQEALIAELLREEEVERKNATRHKKDSSKRKHILNTRTSKKTSKKGDSKCRAQDESAKKRNNSSPSITAASDQQVSLLKNVVESSQSGTTHQQQQQQHAVDVTAVLAALETFSIMRAASRENNAHPSSGGEIPSWLQMEDDNGIVTVARQVVDDDKSDAEEIYDEDFEPDIEEAAE